MASETHSRLSMYMSALETEFGNKIAGQSRTLNGARLDSDEDALDQYECRDVTEQEGCLQSPRCQLVPQIPSAAKIQHDLDA